MQGRSQDCRSGGGGATVQVQVPGACPPGIFHVIMLLPGRGGGGVRATKRNHGYATEMNHSTVFFIKLNLNLNLNLVLELNDQTHAIAITCVMDTDVWKRMSRPIAIYFLYILHEFSGSCRSTSHLSYIRSHIMRCVSH